MKIYKTDYIFEILLKISKIIFYTGLLICASRITNTICTPIDPEMQFLEKEKVKMEIRSYEISEKYATKDFLNED